MLTIFDDTQCNYLLLKLGWTEQGRLYHVTVHARIKQNKIWIEQDWTEEGVGQWLIKQGVPASDIIATCIPPDIRETFAA